MEKKDIAKNISNRLEILLNDYEDKIPSKIINGVSKNTKYKCRKNWFQLWMNEIDTLEVHGILDKKLTRKYIETAKQIENYFEKNNLTNQEQISISNELIKETLNYLDSKY